MKKYKICVYAICRNEASFVDRWVDSMNEADEIIVTDTGSEDQTVEKLRAHGATVHVETIQPWRFDVARNISLDHVPEDADICVCTDLDEVFIPGWRTLLEQAWSDNQKQLPDVTARNAKYLYNWSLKPDGTPDTQLTYCKIHSRQGFRWVYPIHEVVQYVGDSRLETIFVNRLILNHYPDAAKSRGSYLPLLETACQENPQDDRMSYYLGREYMYHREWQKCIDELTRHLSLPSATWNEERCASMRWIAISYHRLEKTKEAYGWYYRAIAEAHYLREPYVELARMGYELHDWVTVFFAAEQALKITEKSATYVNQGYAWDHTPHDLGAIACYHLKMYDRALVHADHALEFGPDDARLQQNRKFIIDKLEK